MVYAYSGMSGVFSVFYNRGWAFFYTAEFLIYGCGDVRKRKWVVSFLILPVRLLYERD